MGRDSNAAAVAGTPATTPAAAVATPAAATTAAIATEEERQKARPVNEPVEASALNLQATATVLRRRRGLSQPPPMQLTMLRLTAALAQAKLSET